MVGNKVFESGDRFSQDGQSIDLSTLGSLNSEFVESIDQDRAVQVPQSQESSVPCSFGLVELVLPAVPSETNPTILSCFAREFNARASAIAKGFQGFECGIAGGVLAFTFGQAFVSWKQGKNLVEKTLRASGAVAIGLPSIAGGFLGTYSIFSPAVQVHRSLLVFGIALAVSVAGGMAAGSIGGYIGDRIGKGVYELLKGIVTLPFKIAKAVVEPKVDYYNQDFQQ